MKRVQFAVTYPERYTHPLHRHIVESPAIDRAELLMWSPTAEATTLVWCDGDRDATEVALDSIDSLRAATLVAEDDGTYAFLQQDSYEFEAAILETIADAAVIFLPPVVFDADGSITFEAAGESGTLSQFHEALSALGTVSIDGVAPFRRQAVPGTLTDRQRAALSTAVEVGYYEVPRTGTVADVAEALDCADSTAGELIRKAEAAVVRAALDAP